MIISSNDNNDNHLKDGYKLCSACIFTEHHFICGINTELGYIIFDSNGLWVFEDWSILTTTKKEMSNYKNKIIKTNSYSHKPNRELLWFGKIVYRIYIKPGQSFKIKRKKF
jgi:hypothetical protein